jgi:hypothetical protein
MSILAFQTLDIGILYRKLLPLKGARSNHTVEYIEESLQEAAGYE